jgi:hypothetical protein
MRWEVESALEKSLIKGSCLLRRHTEVRAITVAFEAVVLPKMTSRPGVNTEAVVGGAMFGPNRNDGNPRVVVFVRVGVTFDTVEKLSG